MGKYDIIYRELVTDIVENGVWDKDQNVRTKWLDGTPAYTKSLISKQIVLDNTEVPILTTKKVAWKSAIHELIWFYIKRTSDVSYLRENNVKIWEEWTRDDNTIGKAYGHQLGKRVLSPLKSYHIYNLDMIKQDYHGKELFPDNQVNNLIYGLESDPASRRHIISLWNIDDAWDMALQPCVWNNQWLVKENKLHLIVGVRSNDCGLGNPFNVFQYYVLQRMVSQITGYEMGTLTFNINDLHCYERHLEPLKEQISRIPYDAPELWINPDIKNFDDFTIDDFKLVDYQHHPKIEMEVAI